MPYELPENLIQICYNWGDYSYLNNTEIKPEHYLTTEGMKVLNFHPIHLFLNTSSISHYNKTKNYSKNINKLCEFINQDTQGIKNYFEQLMSVAIKKTG
jgi:hypothetical protein